MSAPGEPPPRKRGAFAAASPEDRWTLEIAADFTDERRCLRMRGGKICALRTLYLCMPGGAQYPCAMITANAHCARPAREVLLQGVWRKAQDAVQRDRGAHRQGRTPTTSRRVSPTHASRTSRSWRWNKRTYAHPHPCRASDGGPGRPHQWCGLNPHLERGGGEQLAVARLGHLTPLGGHLSRGHAMRRCAPPAAIRSGRVSVSSGGSMRSAPPPFGRVASASAWASHVPVSGRGCRQHSPLRGGVRVSLAIAVANVALAQPLNATHSQCTALGSRARLVPEGYASCRVAPWDGHGRRPWVMRRQRQRRRHRQTQPAKQPTNQTTNKQANQPTDQPTYQATNQPTNRPTSQRQKQGDQEQDQQTVTTHRKIEWSPRLCQRADTQKIACDASKYDGKQAFALSRQRRLVPPAHILDSSARQLNTEPRLPARHGASPSRGRRWQ